MALTLSVTDLAAERGGRTVFEGLAFQLQGGEALSVVGRNGAGKSTLLRVLAGLLVPLTGMVVLDPPDRREPDAPAGERAHYLGHADALKPTLTPRHHLAFLADLFGPPQEGAPPALAPEDALSEVALSHAADLPCGYLSAGQRRRVALARLLVAGRPLWLLDEPATALDAASQAVLSGLMRRHLDAGGLIVAATHGPLGLAASRELRLERA